VKDVSFLLECVKPFCGLHITHLADVCVAIETDSAPGHTNLRTTRKKIALHPACQLRPTWGQYGANEANRLIQHVRMPVARLV